MPVLVLDFDGTMTDAEAEGRPFRDGYVEDLCTLVGRSVGDVEVEAIATRVETELAAAPESHPFLWMERAVAPATVDPYLRMVPIAHAILDHFGVWRRTYARESVGERGAESMFRRRVQAGAVPLARTNDHQTWGASSDALSAGWTWMSGSRTEGGWLPLVQRNGFVRARAVNAEQREQFVIRQVAE